MADNRRCPDCHVQPGHPHDLGCDIARCPACGIQRLQCHDHADDRTLDARAVWTGATSTVAEQPPMVAVRRADLDLVMNHAGDPSTVAGYPAAAQRIRDALEGDRRG